MLDIVREASDYMLGKLKDIQALKKNTLDILEKYTAYHLPATALLRVIFSRPYIKPQHLVDALDCHRQTAYVYLAHMVNAGILIEKRSGREKLYLHKRLSDALSN